MFNYFDIVVVALVLLCFIIGYIRGFIKSIIKLCGRVVKLVIAFFLCKPFAKLISNITSLDDSLINKISTWASGIGSGFNQNLAGLDQTGIDSIVNSCLENSGIPKLIRLILSGIIKVSPETISSYDSITMSDLIGVALTNIIMVVGSFIVIILLLIVVLFILNKVLHKAIEGKDVLVKTNRLLGGFVGIIKAFVLLFITCLIMSLFKGGEMSSEFFTKLDSSLIAGPVSRLMFKLSDKYINFKDMLDVWLKK